MSQPIFTVYLPTLLMAQNGTTSTPSMVGLPAPAQPAPGTAATQALPVGPGGTVGPGSPAPASPFGGSQFMILMVAMLGLMIFMSFWTNRKEQKKRRELMESMKKGDRVQTLGGMIGTVQDVFDTEVVLRLEEGRVRVSRASIQTIIKATEGRTADRAPEVEIKNAREKSAV